MDCPLKSALQNIQIPDRIAVAVSGGPDSMALLFALSEGDPDIEIHALSVDHALRPESAAELQAVGKSLSTLKNVTHHILKWDHGNPETKIMEEARNARYALMAETCKELGIQNLYVAHHGDDQAETILFRIAKGSGIDGLSGMNAVSDYADDMQIVRPFLALQKQDLITYCENRNIDYIEDPSNSNDHYSRVRLRQSMEILGQEGLSIKRLNTLGQRAARSRDALNWTANRAYEEAARVQSDAIILDAITDYPAEIALRVITKAIDELVPQSGYPVRLERLENLVSDLYEEPLFRKRSFAKVIFEMEKGTKNLKLTLETP